MQHISSLIPNYYLPLIGCYGKIARGLVPLAVPLNAELNDILAKLCADLGIRLAACVVTFGIVLIVSCARIR